MDEQNPFPPSTNATGIPQGAASGEARIAPAVVPIPLPTIAEMQSQTTRTEATGPQPQTGTGVADSPTAEPQPQAPPLLTIAQMQTIAEMQSQHQVVPTPLPTTELQTLPAPSRPSPPVLVPIPIPQSVATPQPIAQTVETPPTPIPIPIPLQPPRDWRHVPNISIEELAMRFDQPPDLVAQALEESGWAGCSSPLTRAFIGEDGRRSLLVAWALKDLLAPTLQTILARRRSQVDPPWTEAVGNCFRAATYLRGLDHYDGLGATELPHVVRAAAAGLMAHPHDCEKAMRKAAEVIDKAVEAGVGTNRPDLAEAVVELHFDLTSLDSRAIENWSNNAEVLEDWARRLKWSTVPPPSELPTSLLRADDDPVGLALDRARAAGTIVRWERVPKGSGRNAYLIWFAGRKAPELVRAHRSAPSSDPEGHHYDHQVYDSEFADLQSHRGDPKLLLVQVEQVGRGRRLVRSAPVVLIRLKDLVAKGVLKRMHRSRLVLAREFGWVLHDGSRLESERVLLRDMQYLFTGRTPSRTSQLPLSVVES